MEKICNWFCLTQGGKSYEHRAVEISQYTRIKNKIGVINQQLYGSLIIITFLDIFLFFFSSWPISCPFRPMVNIPASQHGSNKRPASSVRKRPDESSSPFWSTLLWNGIQQGLLQQCQLRTRPSWSWTNASYLWYRDGPGNWNFSIRETRLKDWRQNLISSFLYENCITKFSW